VLAACGVASRRAAEELISAGRVSVNGHAVTTLGARVDLASSTVTVDGRSLTPQSPRTFLLNKPRGFVCSNVPQPGQRSVIDIFSRVRSRLFSAGRLDRDSEGLIVVTNDGLLAVALTHPRYGVAKTYRVTVSGPLASDTARKLQRPIHLAERKTRPARVRVVRRGRSRSVLDITVAEGANREVRRICARVGLAVKRLVRTRIGRLTLVGIPSGTYRALNRNEQRYCSHLRSQALQPQVKEEKE